MSCIEAEEVCSINRKEIYCRQYFQPRRFFNVLHFSSSEPATKLSMWKQNKNKAHGNMLSGITS